MTQIADCLQNSKIFSHLEPRALAYVLEEAVQISGQAGSPVRAEPGDALIVVKGAVAISDEDGTLIASLVADNESSELGLLHAVPRGAQMVSTKPTEALLVRGSVLDSVLSQKHQGESVGTLDGKIYERVSALIDAHPFSNMTLDQICRCAASMDEIDAQKGMTVIRYADRGDKFYVIKSGEAEVWRTDARTGAKKKVATLGPGACFGEEALLSGGFRNADVTMSQQGRLFALGKDDFEKLLAENFVLETSPEDAYASIKRGESSVIDCRYKDEYEVWRIPGSISLPLNTIRENAGQLNANTNYFVYCRTGKRARAAAFLLNQEGLRCSVISGGISSWPFECEGEPTQQISGVPIV